MNRETIIGEISLTLVFSDEPTMRIADKCLLSARGLPKGFGFRCTVEVLMEMSR